MALSADQPATLTSSHSCACSMACQQVHTHCRGCGVLAGPDHVHRLREGYCYALLTLAETGAPTLVPVVQSCWSVRERLRQPLAGRWAPTQRERALAPEPVAASTSTPPRRPW